MSNRIEGTNAALMVTVGADDFLIGCEVSFSFEHSNELILKTSRNSNGHRERRVRISDTAASCQGIATTGNDTDSISIFYLEQELVRRTTQALKFIYEDSDGVTKVLSGNYLIETIQITSTVGDFARFDIQFKGGGDGVTIDPVLPPEGDESGLDSDYWTTTPAATSITGNSVGGKSFAGKEILAVFREGIEYDLVTGSPGNRQAQIGTSTITFQDGFLSGETVTVIWQDDSAS